MSNDDSNVFFSLCLQNSSRITHVPCLERKSCYHPGMEVLGTSKKDVDSRVCVLGTRLRRKPWNFLDLPKVESSGIMCLLPWGFGTTLKTSYGSVERSEKTFWERSMVRNPVSGMSSTSLDLQ